MKKNMMMKSSVSVLDGNVTHGVKLIGKLRNKAFNSELFEFVI